MGALAGKIALVTGAGAGVGRGIARAFAREGAKVIVAEIDEANGRAVADEVGGLFVRTDVSVKPDVLAAVATAHEHFGRLDVLVNNAMRLSPNVLLEDKTDQMLEATLATGLWATWWAMHAAFPIMRTQGAGRIINLTSIDAEAGAWLHSDYNLTKGAIRELTRSAAVEWGRHGILVNAIAPAAAGTVYSQLSAAIPGFEVMANAMNPLGRVGDPEADIGGAAVFLASDAARYVNGETLHVDGGLHIPRYDSRPPELR